ncbi:alpha-galactosidase [Catenulispora sp. GAS73]|uniref:glycoside hydrolase family 36 protein n=1 Tax=Catenulispora sp. GAS73 TaxID=3156269 RepID=UPI0035170FFD
MTEISTFSWGHAALRVEFLVDSARRVRIVGLGPDAPVGSPAAPADDPARAELPRSAGLPLIEVHVTGYGRWLANERFIQTVVGERLAYQGHEEYHEDGWLVLRVDLADPESGLAAEAFFRTLVGVGAVQTWSRLTNRGEHRLTLDAVTSFTLGGIVDSGGHVAGLDLWSAENEWLAEGRWQRRALREVLVDMNHGRHRQEGRSSAWRASQGTWSTGRHLPMGAITARDDSRTLLWQLENPGGWRWEVGEFAEAAYVALLGPTDRDHQWRQALDPGEAFTTVPAAVAIGAAPGGGGDGTGGFSEAVAAMTVYRRALRRPHPDAEGLPVIFNDFMNTVMGDPTTERLLPLIDAAAEVGAECFVIDAGWYAGEEGWWDLVGAWEESATRFPAGLSEVVDRIRDRGMVPGLWLEPEVIGVRSGPAGSLPRAAFFQRDGERVVDNGRYHLDLRHPAAVEHLDAVVDRLVADYGVGYFKLDYNVNPGPGTDLGGSAGVGLLGHERALLDWLDGVLDRHPGLTLENCASGGMRSDYAMLSRLQLQSTSDQQEHYRYPAIAAAAPAAIAPEQAASWTYPQPEFGADENAFALCNALLGRVHLSGNLDRMAPEQRALVADAIAVYKRIRADIPAAVPFWPLGLPGWTDPWIALGLRGRARTYVTVWRRPGEESAAEQVLLMPHFKGRDLDVSVLFPQDTKSVIDWSPGTGELTVQLSAPGTACLIAVV